MNLKIILEELGPILEARAPAVDRENIFVEDNLIELKKRGVYKMLIPTSLGGEGVALDRACYFLRDLATFCPSTSLALSMHTHLISVLNYKHLHGDTDASSSLKNIAANGLILLSTGGGDWINSNGKATQVDGGYEISCVKPFCSGAPIADIAVMSCAYSTDSADEVLHFSIPLATKGVEVLNDWDAMGMRGTGSHTIKFERVFVPDDKISLRRQRGEWHPVWDIVSTLAFPVFIAPYVGVARAIAQTTLETINDARCKNSFCLSSLGEMHNNLRIAELGLENLINTAKNFDVSPDNLTAVNALQDKAIITESTRNCAQSAMEAIGGHSYMKKAVIERLYRDVMAAEFHPMQAGKEREMIGNFLVNKTMNR